MADHAAVAHQFDSMEQQVEAVTLGMWIFLISEVLLFGGLFTAYTYFRVAYPQAFATASGHNNVIIGTVNTVVLIVSSLTMALAVAAARAARRRRLVVLLGTTAALGLVFLVLKAVEYVEHWHAGLVPGVHAEATTGPAALFYWLYFVMTGLHALHLLVGITLVGVLMVLGARGRFGPVYHTPVEVGGLYWHLIDVIWVFLFPLLYLIGLHEGGHG